MVSEKMQDNSTNRNDLVERLYLEQSQWIRETIDKLVRQGEDADDIFQDFFVMLLTKEQLPNSIGHKGFLFRTLSRDVIDFMRRKKAYQNRLGKFAVKKPPATQSKSTLDGLLSQYECDFITQLIENELPKSIRKVLKLHLDCDADYPEISRRLNIGQASARRYLYLSRKRMKSLLTEKGYRFKSTN